MSTKSHSVNQHNVFITTKLLDGFSRPMYTAVLRFEDAKLDRLWNLSPLSRGVSGFGSQTSPAASIKGVAASFLSGLKPS